MTNPDLQNAVAATMLFLSVAGLVGMFMRPFKRSTPKPEPVAPKRVEPPVTYMNGERLSDAEAEAIFKHGRCPDCGCSGLLGGPMGGLSQNVYCANEAACGSRFNVHPWFGVDRITDRCPNERLLTQRSAYRN